MIRIGIIGATGYTGLELLRILQRHSEAEIAWLTSEQSAGQEFGDLTTAGALELLAGAKDERIKRLKAMAETNDGFEIARRDLDIRGPGEFMGARQSGDALLRFADLQADGALLQHARATAPRLLREHPQAAAAHVHRWLAGRAEFLKA